MPDTRTERLNAIADLELEEPGNYTAAASVRAVAVERDALRAQRDELAAALRAVSKCPRAMRALSVPTAVMVGDALAKLDGGK